MDYGIFVCMDELIYDININKSVMFSLSVINDWTFDLGCTVYAFDLNVNFPSKGERNITFKKLGVADKNYKVNLMETLGIILRKHHHRNKKISYLKIHIEEYELTGLPSWLSEGALSHDHQIAEEVHLTRNRVNYCYVKNNTTLIY